jgi:pimeloyl-ACP methyl ester carboxylesterase
MLIPIQGGFPEPAFQNYFEEYRVHLSECDPDKNMIYLLAESRKEPVMTAYQGNLESGYLQKLGESAWGCFPVCSNEDHTQAILIDSYTVGDDLLYRWERGEERHLLNGLPPEERSPGQEIPLTDFRSIFFTRGDRGLLIVTSLFSDTRGLGYLDLSDHQAIQPVEITGLVHTGMGELEDARHLIGDRYLLQYNIDGCSWLYEGVFNEPALQMNLSSVICGMGELSSGVLEAVTYDKVGDRFILAFSTATSPTQIYTVEGAGRKKLVRHTNERTLGIPDGWLSAGEDASFTSFDGTRVSARLYLPAEALNFTGPRPLIYYIHGGPQGQERPDFAWFSMPLIQFLTLNGFAVFVPNVRGSTGYGLNYTKQVDRDWGGQDRLDHVHAMTEVLPRDRRIDTSRSGVVGRSYGGYMTLTLASRHPELWSAAVDMFGPYDLLTFMDRIPETWKPYFSIAVGDPAKDRQFLIERSPCTYMDQILSPLLVIQGKNDPRVVERESRDVVETLRSKGKQVEYLVFENEGHDVLKYENRVTCYNAITNFFKNYLKP